MPGSFTSIVNCALPLVFARLSWRGTRLPINLNCFESLSFTSAGTGIAAAFSASSPKLAFRPPLCETTPFATLISAAGTCQVSAAAATSMARAVAPALRLCSYELAIALLPPVPCIGPHSRLL